MSVAANTHQTGSLDRRQFVVTACSLLALPALGRGERKVAAAKAFSTDRTDMIDALLAEEPHAALGEAADVFAPFAGTWDLTCKRWTADGKEFDSSGVWYFSWILDGRMMQDVIYFFSNGSRRERTGGTTLRIYDPEHKEWRASFYAPARNAIISLAGGQVGNRIVLHGTDTDGSPLRWSFSDMTRKSFRWIGEISDDGGKTWRMEQEMLLTRRRP